MKLYRAIAARDLEKAGKALVRQSTVRIPSNVPYVVDNLWEWLRPSKMPSRRHAVYASPSARLALDNASAPLAEGECYVACEVVVARADIRVAQLAVSDARYHEDIRRFTRWIGRWTGSEKQPLAELALAQRQLIAPLFMPGLRAEELDSLRAGHEFVEQLCDFAHKESRFWASASCDPQDSQGELFFELIDAQGSYRLKACEA